MPDDCPPDKVRNPKTGNCILKTSTIGKSIMKKAEAEAKAKEAKAKEAKEKVPSVKKEKTVSKKKDDQDKEKEKENAKPKGFSDLMPEVVDQILNKLPFRDQLYLRLKQNTGPRALFSLLDARNNEGRTNWKKVREVPFAMFEKPSAQEESPPEGMFNRTRPTLEDSAAKVYGKFQGHSYGVSFNFISKHSTCEERIPVSVFLLVNVDGVLHMVWKKPCVYDQKPDVFYNIYYKKESQRQNATGNMTLMMQIWDRVFSVFTDADQFKLNGTKAAITPTIIRYMYTPDYEVGYRLEPIEQSDRAPPVVQRGDYAQRAYTLETSLVTRVEKNKPVQKEVQHILSFLGHYKDIVLQRRERKVGASNFAYTNLLVLRPTYGVINKAVEEEVIDRLPDWMQQIRQHINMKHKKHYGEFDSEPIWFIVEDFGKYVPMRTD